MLFKNRNLEWPKRLLNDVPYGWLFLKEADRKNFLRFCLLGDNSENYFAFLCLSCIHGDLIKANYHSYVSFNRLFLSNGYDSGFFNLNLSKIDNETSECGKAAKAIRDYCSESKEGDTLDKETITTLANAVNILRQHVLFTLRDPIGKFSSCYNEKEGFTNKGQKKKVENYSFKKSGSKLNHDCIKLTLEKGGFPASKMMMKVFQS